MIRRRERISDGGAGRITVVAVGAGLEAVVMAEEAEGMAAAVEVGLGME